MSTLVSLNEKVDQLKSKDKLAKILDKGWGEWGLHICANMDVLCIIKALLVFEARV